jgi:GNAT superfamily N-acetyltransferase
MPQIEIRPALSGDIVTLIDLDHSCVSPYVWQMDRRLDEGQIQVNFREIRLPRSVTVAYPRDPYDLAENWQHASGLLVATFEENVVGYVYLKEQLEVQTVILRDIVVAKKHRHQGIGTGLVLAAKNWAVQRGFRRISMEMPSKNYPAIRLAMKLGFEFSGYNDAFYSNKDIALFFSRFLK